ncbi:hypothetical protein C7S17_3477 [Burkholderia thailandensis]|nr:hypothetical protein [Burkholderia thailandensis]
MPARERRAVSGIRHCRRAGRRASANRRARAAPAGGMGSTGTKKGSLGCLFCGNRPGSTPVAGAGAKLTSRPCRWRVRRTCS